MQGFELFFATSAFILGLVQLIIKLTDRESKNDPFPENGSVQLNTHICMNPNDGGGGRSGSIFFWPTTSFVWRLFGIYAWLGKK
ncbi:hypothetical protein AZ66_18095 [Paenibacillus sp. E194]|uniref:hypothetical protein n=1 Tax=Paenibacillus sp. E194 TaxID=1458845 RepID=UPI0005CA5271|nr:hypothetical protein [Paenibacillus sp. E194]KJB86557.1 hypothetical protein AZ66_18095 [Paenibacillus sp. E194]